MNFIFLKIKFQFLMVRLKGNDADVLNLFTEISIPYGAIKSGEFSADYAANNKISIPYGAIKSHYNKNYTPRDKLFQFLMVRLKASSFREL